MADGIEFEWLNAVAVEGEMAAIVARVAAATPEALDEVAKVMVDTARGHARVYQGPDPRIPPGRLAASIAATGTKPTDLGVIEGTVPPEGVIERSVSPQGMAHLYAHKIERLQPFMQPGRDAGEAAAAEIFEAAWQKATHA